MYLLGGGHFDPYLFLLFRRQEMPEIESEVQFEVGPDQAKLTTQTNGDILILSGIVLTQTQAATLAYLVNSKKNLSFEVREIL